VPASQLKGAPELEDELLELELDELELELELDELELELDEARPDELDALEEVDAPGCGSAPQLAKTHNNKISTIRIISSKRNFCGTLKSAAKTQKNLIVEPIRWRNQWDTGSLNFEQGHCS
jgi:hypothetical protein